MNDKGEFIEWNRAKSIFEKRFNILSQVHLDHRYGYFRF